MKNLQLRLRTGIWSDCIVWDKAGYNIGSDTKEEKIDSITRWEELKNSIAKDMNTSKNKGLWIF